MATTTNLDITLVEASQSQKHVTVNEALNTIDSAVGPSLASNGGAINLHAVEEELTLTGASVTSTVAFPNQCIILGCSVRVTEAITGATSFDVGDGSTVDRFGGTLGIALDSTNQGTIGPAGNYANTTVTVTANGSNFTGGKVRICLHYINLVTPTS